MDEQTRARIRSPVEIDEAGCWIWQLSKDHGGYVTDIGGAS